MPALTTSNASLPRTLKRPFYTFILVLVAAYVLILLLSILIWIGSGSSHTLVMFGILGAPALIVFGLVGLAGRQTFTVFHDHLEFSTSKQKSIVFYKDVGEVTAIISKDGPPRVHVMMLHIQHAGAGISPLILNLELFKDKDRVLLLELIKQGAPNARFNDLAEKVRLG